MLHQACESAAQSPTKDRVIELISNLMPFNISMFNPAASPWGLGDPTAAWASAQRQYLLDPEHWTALLRSLCRQDSAKAAYVSNIFIRLHCHGAKAMQG